MDQAYLDDLIGRAAAKAAAQAAEERRVLRPPVSEADLDRAEQLLGFRLHPLLRRLYSEVADGGFGPEYTLFSLLGQPGRAVVSEGRRPQHAVDLQDGEQMSWPFDAVAIMDWGCAMNAVVDCRSPDGTVLLVDPNAGLPDRAKEWFIDSGSLAGWLEAWLAGTGWYHMDLSVEDPDMPLWAEAAARLTERDPPVQA